MTYDYETDLAAAKRERRAWGCPCVTDNPPAYDTCHACQSPSWTCATCGTVNPAARSECNECGSAMSADQLGDREEGAEMTWEEWIGLQIGLVAAMLVVLAVVRPRIRSAARAAYLTWATADVEQVLTAMQAPQATDQAAHLIHLASIARRKFGALQVAIDLTRVSLLVLAAAVVAALV